MNPVLRDENSPERFVTQPSQPPSGTTHSTILAFPP
jgi:hypothetical protein